MSDMDFHIEFNIELPDIQEKLLDELAAALRELSSDHNDLVGAAVSAEKITGVETPYIYRARIVVYIRPENMVAVEEAKSPELALRGALNAIEHRVRAARLRRKKPWKRPDLVKSDPVYGLSEEEMYATYGDAQELGGFVQRDPTEIASDLMVKHKLTREAAYYAADLILEYARRVVDEGRRPG